MRDEDARLLATRAKALPDGNAGGQLTSAIGIETYALALDKIRQGLCVYDGQQRLLMFNRRYAEMYDIKPEALRLGMTLREVIDLRYAAGTGPEMAPEQYALWRDEIAVADRVIETVVELRNGNVHEIHHEPTADGGWVGTFDDITERRRTERLMWHMARHDPLTDLPNRHEFRERLEVSLALIPRGKMLGVHCLDLDRFKEVNDTFGHAFGDRLLCEVANRMRDRLGSSDVLTRLGGDEFAIVQPSIRDVTEAEQLARSVVRTVGRSYLIAGHQVRVGASVGIAFAPNHGSDPDTLLRHADAALYKIKRNGRGGHACYLPAEAAAA